MEILLTVDMPTTNNVPVQISIVYDDDGEVASCDWRHALPDIIECMELDMENLDDYNSDEDPDWIPHNPDTDTEDDEPLEYDSNEEDSDY
jgi:hypothetical protein